MLQVIPPKATGPQHRAAEVGRVDKQARTVELAFSSEAPVERSFGLEILDHGASSVDLSKMRSGAPLLMDHIHSDQIGVVESVRIDPDRVGRAVVRFGNGQRASEIFQDVADGIRRNVSVGYRVFDATEDSEGVYRFTRWQPYEISIVSVPADSSVGVGRAVAKPTSDPHAEYLAVLAEQERSLSTLSTATMQINSQAVNALANDITGNDGLAPLVRAARNAMGHNPGGSGPFSVKPAVAGRVRLADMLPTLPNAGRYSQGLTNRTGSGVYTLLGAVSESSVACQLGARIVSVKSSAESVANAQGLAATYVQRAKFTVIKPAVFGEVAEGATVPLSIPPRVSAEIENIASGVATHAARFVLERHEMRDMTDEEISALVTRAAAFGVAQVVDRVIAAAILAGAPTAYSLAKLATAGIPWSGARAVVGRNGAGAVGVEGGLYVQGVPAVTSDQTASTILGDWSRVAAATADEVTIILNRMNAAGRMEVTILCECAALVPDAPNSFWTVAA